MANNKTGRSRGRPKAFHDKTQEAIIQSLDRAMEVLKVVAAGGGMSLTEIAQTGGQSAPTCYRILTTLKQHRIVEFDDVSQLWHVGLDAFRIGMSFLGRTRITEQSRPVMQRMMAETGETANLAILDGAEVVFLTQVETHQPIRAFFPPGTRGPFHASGIGKAIMAYLPEIQFEQAAPDMLEKFTDQTIGDLDELKSELVSIRRRGYSIDNEERTVGMRCIAAPVFNAHGEAIAGVSISGPSVRVRPEADEQLGRIVRQAADEITKSTGGHAPTS